jgi:nitrogen fixation protein FixH
MTRKFTGRHMLILMIAFFGTVIAVNVTMATLATRTFGGTVVDNSYVASQRFNTWLGEARAQRALGWSARLELDRDRRLVATLEGEGAPIVGASVSAVAGHPVGRATDVTFAFEPLGGGRYRSAAALPPGRWNLHLTVARGDDVMRVIESIR